MRKIITKLQLLLSPIRDYFFAILLCVMLVFIAGKNFEPHHWLTGWDTLHPEFDFALNIKRMLFGVWREDQGLGALAAHSHMSDLPRVIILWLLSLVLPLASVKYVVVLLCFVLGPLGIFFFAQNTLNKTTHNQLAADVGALSAGLFYAFNLGTVQHFYVVFEMFAFQYAAIGWLFMQATRYIEMPSRKSALVFFALALISTPMAYASMLWMAFALGLTLYCAGLFLSNRTKARFHSSTIILYLLVAANAFWLLPNLYFIFSGASSISALSHINQLFSPEAFLHNQAYGTTQDVALLKNFLFSWSQYDVTSDQTSLLMKPWIEHLKNPVVTEIGYLVFLLSLLGAFIGIFRKNARAIALLPVATLAIVMLINSNPPFETLFNLLRSQSNLFEEGLRFPFTKFSILLMICESVFFGIAWSTIVQHIPARLRSLSALVPFIPFLLLSYYCLPMFRGQLIAQNMRNTIPGEYFEFFEWARSQPEQTRFIQFPLQTSAGWDQYSWGYEGPGFLWFGMKQPLAVRDFDRWEEANETLYNQLSTALYAGDTVAFQGLLQKYQLGFAVIDESIVSPGLPRESLKINQTMTYLEKLGAKRAWSSGALTVFDLRPVTGAYQFTQAPTKYTHATGNSHYAKVDVIYPQTSNYVTLSQETDQAFPFAQLMIDRALENATFSNNEVVLNVARFGESYPTNSLIIPGFTHGELFTTQFTASYTGGLLEIIFSDGPTIRLGGHSTQLPKLPNLTLPIVDQADQLLFQINDQQFFVEKDIPTTHQLLTLQVGQETTIYAVDVQKIGQFGSDLAFNVKQAEKFQLSSDIWHEITKSTKLDITGVSSLETLTVTIPTYALPIDVKNQKWAFNCDPFGRGSIEKFVDGETALYTARDLASTCEHFTLAQLRGHEPFLLAISGTGIAGRGTKVYLRNTETQKLAVEQLLPTGKFSSIFSVVPPRSSETSAYALTLETRSFGARKSSNVIDSLTILPFGHLQKISGIQTEPIIQPSKLDNSIIMTSVTKLNPSMYSVKLQPAGVANVDDPGLIVLLQSFNQGWIAVDTHDILNPLEHATYNGWANAWETTRNRREVLIFYWPQALESAGFGLLFATAIWFGFSLARNPEKTRSRVNSSLTARE